MNARSSDRCDRALMAWRYAPGFLGGRVLPGGRYVVATTLMFHYTVISGRGDDSPVGSYDRQWCFRDKGEAILAVADPDWDGISDPKQDWHKSRPDGRVRIDGKVYTNIDEATLILGTIR